MTDKTENKNPNVADKFFEGKSVFTKITMVVTFAIVLCWLLLNFSVVTDIAGKFFSLFRPVVYGFFFAYLINIFMVSAEKLWDRIFAKKKTKTMLKRAICLILSIILVSGIVFSVLFLIVPELTATVYDIINKLPIYIEKTVSFFESIFKNYDIRLPEFKVDAAKIQTELGKILPKIGSNFFSTTVDVTSSIFSAVFNFVLAFVFALYMLIQKEKLCLYLKRLLFAVFKKSSAEKTLFYLDLTSKTFTRFVTGQLTEAVIIGILCFIGMVILRIPYALIISVLVGFTALIPVFGAFIGTFIGAFLIVAAEPVKAVWFNIFIIVLQQLEGNLIYPRVVGKSVGLPGILVLTAVTVGGSAFGIGGMLFAVPVISVLYTVLNQFIEKRLREKKIKL